MVRKLLLFAARSEVGFGLLLLAMPEVGIGLLLSLGLSGSAVVAGRVVGACLIALGVGCWPRGTGRRELYVMMVYSLLAALSLAALGLRWSAGVLLWPAAAAHGTVAFLLWLNRQKVPPDAGRTT